MSGRTQAAEQAAEQGERAAERGLLSVQAVVADLDGVITSTARQHFEAWQRAFDRVRDAAGRAGAPLSQEEYRQLLDGLPRYEGAARLLAARGIDLPRGAPEDAPGEPTACGFGNLKNGLYQRLVEEEGVAVFPDALARLREWRARGLPVAMATASRNGERVVAEAGLGELFAAQVDGAEMARLGLEAKATLFREAASRLGVEPRQAALLEDARAGVEAGLEAGFGLVVGVAREGRADLARAHRVVGDLRQLRLPSRGPASARLAREVPELSFELAPALAGAREAFAARLAGYRPALFLDFDGTLSPIVDDPDDARLHPAAQVALQDVAERVVVCVVSGRDRADVARRVGLEGITYAGSHGMDIAGPTAHLQHEEAEAARPALDEAEAELRRRLRQVEGAVVERKRYGIAVHTRMVAPAQKEAVSRVVREVREAQGGRLRQSAGKEVAELQPPVDWHKGRAVEFLLARLGLQRAEVLPIYVGDDLTDEDAFAALGERGVGVLVGCPQRETRADFRLPDDPRAVAALLREVDRQAAGAGGRS